MLDDASESNLSTVSPRLLTRLVVPSTTTVGTAAVAFPFPIQSGCTPEAAGAKAK